MFWDDTIVESIAHYEVSKTSGYCDDDDYNDELFYSDDDGRNCKRVASKILNHRGKGGKVSVQIKWEGTLKAKWEPVSRSLREDEDLRCMLVEYAIENRLTGEFGWGWTSAGIHDIAMKEIIDHTDNPLEVIVEW